jgi:hypothetical protein
MGLTESRLSSINTGVINFELINPSWKLHDYKNLHFNQGGPFLDESCLIIAGQKIGEFFKNISFEPHILEVCAGNGKSSFIIRIEILNFIDCPMISTDLYHYDNIDSSHIVNSNIDSSNAVDLYGEDTNTLLLVSPPPGFYVDYFAISKWEKLSGERYILYLGELGASDGGEGMYKYMLESPIWKLELRYMLSKNVDCFGSPVEKELFIFSKMK